MTGGYTIIDFKNINITDEAVKIEGVYQAIEGANKPTIVENLNVNGMAMRPLFVNFSYLTPYMASLNFGGKTTYTVTITSDDMVTITAD